MPTGSKRFTQPERRLQITLIVNTKEANTPDTISPLNDPPTRYSKPSIIKMWGSGANFCG